MLIGRYVIIVPMLALAGSMVAKQPSRLGRHVPNPWRTVGRTVVGIILIVGGFTFFPALALGPIVEHYAMMAGQLF